MGLNIFFRIHQNSGTPDFALNFEDKTSNGPTTDVSIYGDVVPVVRASSWQRRIRHPDSAAREILNPIQVRFPILELHYHKSHFHYKTPRSSKFIIRHQQQWLSVIHATKKLPATGSFIFQRMDYVCLQYQPHVDPDFKVWNSPSTLHNWLL